MKKLLILAIAAAPIFAVAQTKTPAPTNNQKDPREAGQSRDGAQTGQTREGSKTPVAQNPEALYIEVVITETQQGSMMRVDPGREQMGGIQDKEVLTQLGELRSAQFYSVPDAMTYLFSLGFRHTASYQVVNGGKNETHLVFEKKLARRAPGTTEKPGVSKPGAEPATPATPASPTTKPDKKK